MSTGIISPDGKFMWTGDDWIPSPPDYSDPILSPDDKFMWTGKKWIPAPPDKSQIKWNRHSWVNLEIMNMDMVPSQLKNARLFGKYNKNYSKINLNNILASFAAVSITFFITSIMISSQLIQPLLYDASLVRTGRYALTYDAWDTIAEEDGFSIVAIGSSMMQYAVNGSCVENQLNIEDTFVYNLAIPGSMPYMEMIQTEAAVNANPDIILLELGPNSLWDIYEYDSQSLTDYYKLRLGIISLMIDDEDKGDWQNILRDSEKSFMDLDLLKYYNSEGDYANEAFEETLRRLILDKSLAPRETSAAFVPNPSNENWHDYLRTQNWLYSKLERMSVEERSNWENETVVNAVLYGVNRPLFNGTLNHDALEYMVDRFSKSGIKVILTSPPLHPLLLDQLDPGQYDGQNATLDRLSSIDNVEVLNFIWKDIWKDEDFYDHNHLDRHGRNTFCQLLASELIDIIGE